jgi:ABC-type molybdate transport system permease subunit
MQTGNQIESEIRPYSRHDAIAFSTVTTLLVCLSEFSIIHSLWFNATASFDIIDAIAMPVMVLIPGLIGVYLLFQIGRLGEKGQIHSSAVAMLSFSISLMIYCSIW